MKVTRVGYLCGLVGATIMIGSEIILGMLTLFIYFIVSLGVTGPGLYGLELMPVTVLISLALGVVALKYVLKSRKGSKRAFLIVLIIGIIAAIGVFIPILPARILDLGGGDTYPAPAVNLVNSLLYIESYLLINCGLIGLLSFVESDVSHVEAEDYSLATNYDA